MHKAQESLPDEKRYRTVDAVWEPLIDKEKFYKVQKLLTSGELKIEQQQSFVQWQHPTDVLLSLNYTKQEVAKVISHLAEKHTDQNYPLDQLIRAALSFLSVCLRLS